MTVHYEQGDHEHLVTVCDVRLAGPDDPQNVGAYPLLRSIGTYISQYCMACQAETGEAVSSMHRAAIADFLDFSCATVPRCVFFWCKLKLLNRTARSWALVFHDWVAYWSWHGIDPGSRLCSTTYLSRKWVDFFGLEERTVGPLNMFLNTNIILPWTLIWTVRAYGTYQWITYNPSLTSPEFLVH